ncbi:MAG: sigma-54-dependent Fis family transcriptional regulator [Sedimentisphaerales bacterium]|nr:sigma-54-dependent Fis family transcriptional regulator [Sedimentisphaerales bacterium]
MRKDAVVLIVEEDSHHSEAMAEALGKAGVKVIRSDAVSHALELISQKRVDLIISDLFAGRNPDGIELLDTVRRDFTSIPVILTADSPDLEACKDAIRRGAWDFLVKPVEAKRILALAERAIPSVAVPKGATLDYVFPGVISRSPVMQSVFRVLRRVSKTDLSILIEGESGTGKELTARAIHENSHRADKQFLPINCAGLSESLLESELFGHVKGAFTGALNDRKGLFQLADKGTLFLDEIGDMPLPMQAKLLRVLEDGLILPVGGTSAVKVDVRIISATNQDLAKLVEEKKFRQDLYFRIKGVSVTLPALRNRPQDIPELFGYFLRQACQEVGSDIHLITEPAMRAIMSYAWPGNIRQLRNTVRMMVVMCDHDTLDLRDLPPEIARVKELAAPVEAAAGNLTAGLADMGADSSLEEIEREHIRRVLEMTGNNRTEAAKILKIGERTLYRKIKEYNL